MKRYTSPEIVIVELESKDIAVLAVSNIEVDPEESWDFAPEHRKVRGAAWEDYEQ